jgi:hypothetical protein
MHHCLSVPNVSPLEPVIRFVYFILQMAQKSAKSLHIGRQSPLDSTGLALFARTAFPNGKHSEDLQTFAVKREDDVT